MTNLRTGSFAEACYDMNTIADLEAALQQPADETDMREWGLTADEWRAEIATALAAKRDDAADA